MENYSLSILLAIIATVSGGIGYFVRKYFDDLRELKSIVTTERRKIYQDFVDLILDSFKEAKGGAIPGNSSIIDKIFAIHKRYVLYASPKVIKSFSNLFQYMYSKDTAGKTDTKEVFLMLAKIIADMRSELGLSNKGLGSKGEMVFRAIIKDYDLIMTKSGK